MKRKLTATVIALGAATASAIALAPSASAAPPHQWHPCSQYFRAVTDPQAWQGVNQPIVSPWGTSGVFCSFDVIDGAPVGFIDAYQVDPTGRPHAMGQFGLGYSRWLWATNPF